MKSFRRSVKALSPVVASIILIAVTVAVSIAVAAWMGALSVNFMATEQLTITNVQFKAGNAIELTVRNSGSANITISSATVNGVDATVTGAPVVVVANSPGTITLTPSPAWATGNTYQIRLMSAKGNYFPYTAVAP